MLTWILLLLIMFLTWKLCSDHHQKKFPPGPIRLPFIGHLWSLIKLRNLPTHLRYHEILCKYGPIVGLKVLGKNIILLGNTALVKEAFTDDKLSSRPGGYLMKIRSGKGLKPASRPMGVATGTLWKDHRAFFLKHFRNSEYGKSHFDINVHREISDLLEIFSNRLNSISCINADTFVITVLNVIWKIVAGIRFSHTDPFIKQMMHNIVEQTRYFEKSVMLWEIEWLNKNFPRTTKINRYLEIKDSLKKIISCEISKHKRNMNDGAPNDFVESFLQATYQNHYDSQFYTEDELIMTCLDLFIAGTETTNSILQWTILLMVLHPSIQSKVHQELQRNIDDEELLTLAHRPLLPYTMAVLSEVNRVCSILPVTVPHYATENITLLGYEIPKGSYVFGSLYTIHQDSGYWDNPEAFVPERFLDTNGKFINNENLVPFSLGKRKCLGEDIAQSEIFLVVGSLLQRFKFALPAENAKPSLERQNGMVCVPLPFSVIVTER